MIGLQIIQKVYSALIFFIIHYRKVIFFIVTDGGKVLELYLFLARFERINIIYTKAV